MRRFGSGLVLLVVLLGATGCAGRGPIQGLTPDELFERAMADYEAGRYNGAVVAFERLLILAPHHPRIEEARYGLAMAHMGKKEYILAAEEFRRLSLDFPDGPYAEEARYRVCEAYRRLSPKPQLDQEFTEAAIDHCQALVLYYPLSQFVPQAQEIVREMTAKLAEKVMIGGEYYFRRRAYDSAIIYFEEALHKYPESPVVPRALLRLVQAYVEIGDVDEARAARDKLLSEHPASPEAKKAMEITVGGG